MTPNRGPDNSEGGPRHRDRPNAANTTAAKPQVHQQDATSEPVGPATGWLAGYLAKTAGIAQVDEHESAWWKSCADAAIAHLAAQGRPFDAYAVAELGVPEPQHPNAWGARFHQAARDGVIQPCGVVQSRRPRTARSLVRLWVGVDPAELAAGAA
jgi:hypothetical protein